MKLKISQGDSFAYDWGREDGTLLDETWTGQWAIVTSLGTLPVKSGGLTLSDRKDVLQLRILPEDMEVVPVGSYILVVQIRNDGLNFRREVMQTPFIVGPQGIPS